MKIRVAFVIGQYPPEERKLREQVALSYATPEIEIGIISTPASPYVRGMSPTDIQMAAPLFIEAFREAERQGYDAVVPLGMLDLGVDGGKSAVDIPVVGPFEASFHACGRSLRPHCLSPEDHPVHARDGSALSDGIEDSRFSQRWFCLTRYRSEPRSDGRELRRSCPGTDPGRRRGGDYSNGHHSMPGPYKTRLAAGTARRSSGGRIRRADSHGGAAGRSWLKTE
jgi:hypothetical protein